MVLSIDKTAKFVYNNINSQRKDQTIMYMKLKDGKSKVITLSYDDGVVQDIRLIEIMNKYGLKGTFNINSGVYFPEDGVRERYYGRMKLSEAKELYTNSGHEIAVHALTHPFLEKLSTDEVIYEITEDRKNIERDYNTIVRGMAYPFGTYNDDVIKVLEMCKIAYSRTVFATQNFGFPDNWLKLNPTCHHRVPNLMELADKFLEGNKWNKASMFYLWGHSYEFDNDDNWNVIEEFAKKMGGRDDIWYATNIEIYDYVKAYESLVTSFDKKIIHNPSSIPVWVFVQGETVCINPGETLYL